MAAPRSPLNPTTHSVGFTAKLVTVRSISADRATAVCVDRQSTQTTVNMLVQRSKGPLPALGETWLLTQDLGTWTFAAFVASSPLDFALSGSSDIVVSAEAPAFPATGALWMDTADGNQVREWTGLSWSALPFGTAAIADAAVTSAKIAPGAITAVHISPVAGITAGQVAFTASDIGGTRVFQSTTAPTGAQNGDLWLNPAAGNMISQWNGGAWVPLLIGASAIAPGTVIAGIVDGTVISGAVFEGTNWIENSAGLFLYGGTPASGNLIFSIAAVAGLDAHGNKYLAGSTSYGPASPSGFRALNNNNGVFTWLTATTMAGPWTAGPFINGAINGQFTVDVNGVQTDIQLALGPDLFQVAAAFAFGSMTGFQFVPGVGLKAMNNAQAETWQSLGTAGSTGCTPHAARYRMTVEGECEIDISLTAGSGGSTAGTYTWSNTLPAMYQFQGNYSRAYTMDYVDPIPSGAENPAIVIDGAATATPGRVRMFLPALGVNTLFTVTVRIPLT